MAFSEERFQVAQRTVISVPECSVQLVPFQVCEEDLLLDGHKALFSDPLIVDMNPELTTDEERLIKFIHIARSSAYLLFYAGLYQGEFIGHACLDDINRRDLSFFIVGNLIQNYRNAGIGGIVGQVLLQRAKHIGLRHAYALARENNLTSQNLLRRGGFNLVEGRRRENMVSIYQINDARSISLFHLDLEATV